MSSQSTSLTVAAVLRERITSGAVAPGGSLPKRADLATEFGVSGSVIRQALTTLEDEGLVTLGRGAPATVNEPPPPAPAPQTAGVLLPDRIRAAFEAEHVTIDVFSLTTETLHDALAFAYKGVRAGELTPRTVTLRVLVPAIDARLALPRLVADPADPRPLQRLHGIMHTCQGTLEMGLESLRALGLVEDASLQFRSVPVTPMHKLYLLNGTESLLGYYQVVPRTVVYEEEEMSIFDVLGIDAKLFRSSCGPDARDGQDAAFVRSSQAWFDSLWSTMAQPFTLG